MCGEEIEMGDNYGNNHLIEHQFLNNPQFLTLYKLQIPQPPTIATQDTASTRIRGSNKEGRSSNKLSIRSSSDRAAMSIMYLK